MQEMDAERLKRWKCLYCGCNDKNIIDVRNGSDERLIKIVTCEACGHTDIFGISALAVSDMLMHQPMQRKSVYEEFASRFHMLNHNPPSATKPNEPHKIPR